MRWCLALALGLGVACVERPEYEPVPADQCLEGLSVVDVDTGDPYGDGANRIAVLARETPSSGYSVSIIDIIGDDELGPCLARVNVADTAAHIDLDRGTLWVGRTSRQLVAYRLLEPDRFGKATEPITTALAAPDSFVAGDFDGMGESDVAFVTAEPQTEEVRIYFPGDIPSETLQLSLGENQNVFGLAAVEREESEDPGIDRLAINYDDAGTDKLDYYSQFGPGAEPEFGGNPEALAASFSSVAVTEYGAAPADIVVAERDTSELVALRPLSAGLERNVLTLDTNGLDAKIAELVVVDKRKGSDNSADPEILARLTDNSIFWVTGAFLGCNGSCECVTPSGGDIHGLRSGAPSYAAVAGVRGTGFLFRDEGGGIVIDRVSDVASAGQFDSLCK